jgi:hypothetical protein
MLLNLGEGTMTGIPSEWKDKIVEIIREKHFNIVILTEKELSRLYHEENLDAEEAAAEIISEYIDRIR